MDLEPWRRQFLSLLDVARLGTQFPDAAKWRALGELLGRDGPRGRPLKLARSPMTGLPTPHALALLHRLQRVARDFLATHRHRPSAQARAFSVALAAVDLPPVLHTYARLVTRGKPDRFQLVHERLGGTASRFTVHLAQHRGDAVRLGRDQQAYVSSDLTRALVTAGGGDARDVALALKERPGLEVSEVVHGQLGPYVSSLWPARPDSPADVRFLREFVDAQPGGGAVLSVSLTRLGGDVAAPSDRDPWVGPMPPLDDLPMARERRLFCTPELEAPLRAALASRGHAVLVRSR